MICLYNSKPRFATCDKVCYKQVVPFSLDETVFRSWSLPAYRSPQLELKNDRGTVFQYRLNELAGPWVFAYLSNVKPVNPMDWTLKCIIPAGVPWVEERWPGDRKYMTCIIAEYVIPVEIIARYKPMNWP